MKKATKRQTMKKLKAKAFNHFNLENLAPKDLLLLIFLLLTQTFIFHQEFLYNNLF